MPRAHLGTGHSSGAPLTVTAVSVKLGIPPSTLRTWERRYGLGPSDRRTGEHRRYVDSDVARLARMVELVRRGVTPANAAAIALNWREGDETPDSPPPHCVHDLVTTTRNATPRALRECLAAAISTEGLVHTWSRLVSPALDRLRGDARGELPGSAPSIQLNAAFLEVLGSIAKQRPRRKNPLASIAILTDTMHELAAHVVGVALMWYGIDARVVTTGRIGMQIGPDRFRAHFENRPIELAIVMGADADCEVLIRVIAQESEVDVLLVGADAPPVVDARVMRVRTPAACVEEVLAMLAPGVDLTEIGG